MQVVLYIRPHKIKYRVLVSQAFICEKRCGDAGFYFIFLFHEASKHTSMRTTKNEAGGGGGGGLGARII